MAHDEIAKTIATVGSYNTKFLTSHEFESVSALVDVIIPKDDVSGSASDAKVPEWIDWNGWLHVTAKTPLRGGLAWMDRQCRRRYDADFKDCTLEQQNTFVEDLAFPDHIAEDLGNFGKDYFNMMRNYAISGFYSSRWAMTMSSSWATNIWISSKYRRNGWIVSVSHMMILGLTWISLLK